MRLLIKDMPPAYRDFRFDSAFDCYATDRLQAHVYYGALAQTVSDLAADVLCHELSEALAGNTDLRALEGLEVAGEPEVIHEETAGVKGIRRPPDHHVILQVA